MHAPFSLTQRRNKMKDLFNFSTVKLQEALTLQGGKENHPLNISAKKIKKELAKRKAVEQIPIPVIKSFPPASVQYQHIRALVIVHMQTLIREGWGSYDAEYVIYQGVMEALYGEEIFDTIHAYRDAHLGVTLEEK